MSRYLQNIKNHLSEVNQRKLRTWIKELYGIPSNTSENKLIKLLILMGNLYGRIINTNKNMFDRVELV